MTKHHNTIIVKKKPITKAQVKAAREAENDLSRMQRLHAWYGFWSDLLFSIKDPDALEALFTKCGGNVTTLFIPDSAIQAAAEKYNIDCIHADDIFRSLNAMQRIDLLNVYAKGVFGTDDCVGMHVRIMTLLEHLQATRRVAKE
jgi:hypothetical protein